MHIILKKYCKEFIVYLAFYEKTSPDEKPS